MNQNLARAHLLISQSRFDLAEQEVRRSLAVDGENSEAHRLLALCLCERKQWQDAQAEADAAVHLDPEDAASHNIRGWVLYRRRHLDEAREAVEEALRLDPANQHTYSLLGQIALERKDWKTVMVAAERSLELDPENTEANNLRAIALVKLGRRAEAGEVIESVLERDPDDALTHANMGWTMLHAGQTKEACEHFREALRLDPNLEWARLGILEAMKARNFIYRWLLYYFLWISRFGTRTQWVIVLGGFFGAQLVSAGANAYPNLAPYFFILLGIYVAFALMTWLGSPLFNLLLMLDRFGRLTLDGDQKMQAYSVGICLALGMVTLALALTDSMPKRLGPGILAAVFVSVSSIPISAIWPIPKGWPRQRMMVVAGVVAAMAAYVWLFWVIIYFNPPVPVEWAPALIAGYNFVSQYFVFAFLGSQLAANILRSVEVRR